jgi:ABC-type antimicrobial peptide transport system permease subunit
MKKIITGAGILLLVLATMGSASAATIENITDESEVTFTFTSLLNLLVNNTSMATITNNVTSVSSTGGNTITADDDLEDVTLETGDATAVIAVENIANDSEVDVDVESANTSDTEINNVDESTVDVTEEQEDNIEVNNEQEVDVDNQTVAVASTGDNFLDADEIKGLVVRTGSADTALSIENMFNFSSLNITRRIAN